MAEENQLFPTTRLRKVKRLEKDIQGEILDYLKSLSFVYVIKVHSATKSGIADVITCIGGAFVTFEIKRSSKEKATELQIYNAKKVTRTGGLACVVYDLDQVKHIVADVIAYINSIDFKLTIKQDGVIA